MKTFLTVAVALTTFNETGIDHRIIEQFNSMEECQQVQPYLQRKLMEDIDRGLELRARQLVREAQGWQASEDEALVEAKYKELLARNRVECHATTFATGAN